MAAELSAPAPSTNSVVFVEKASAPELVLPECVQQLSDRLHAQMATQEALLKLILARTDVLSVESPNTVCSREAVALRLQEDEDSAPKADNHAMFVPGTQSSSLMQAASDTQSSLASALPFDDLQQKSRNQAYKVSQVEQITSDQAPQKHSLLGRIQRRLKSLICSTTFDMGLCMAICANTIFAGLEIDFSGRECCQKGSSAASIFSSIQLGFTALFSIETWLRILAKGCRGYFVNNPEWNWDFFDLALVLSSLAEIILNNSLNADIANLVFLRVVRVARIVSRAGRIMRLFRLARFFRPLRIIIRSLFFTLKSLGWIAVLLAMIVYVFALVLTSSTIDYINSDNITSTPESMAQLKMSFGSVVKSVFSLYSSVSGGLDWLPVVFLLAEIHAIWGAVFVLFQFTMYWAVIHVITGVCCQCAIDCAHKDTSMVVDEHLSNLDELVERFKQLFTQLDTDGSGTLTIAELEEHFDDAHVQAYFESLDIEARDAWTLFSLLDTDSSHTIDIEEFVTGCLRLKGSARAVDILKMSVEGRWMVKKLHNLSAGMHKFEQQFAGLSSLVVAALQSRSCSNQGNKRLSL